MFKESPTLAAKQIINNRIKNNKPVYNGGLGENPLPISNCLQNELKKYVHLKEYTSTDGIIELQKILGNNLVVGNGSKELIFILQLAYSKIYSGGCILYIYPAWVSYMEQSNILNIKTDRVEVDNNYKINYLDLENKLKSIYPIPALIIFNNPCNPTGIIYTKSEVKKLANIFNKYNTIVLNDHIYKDLVHTKYEDEYGDISKYYENTINSNSLSKTFACGGYRFGWLSFPDNNNKLNNLLLASTSIASSIYSCPTLALQYVAVKALTFPIEIQKDIKFQKEMYQNIGEYLYGELTNINLKCSVPQAAWYIWINFENYKIKFSKNNINNSNELTLYLAEKFGIIVISGNAFGLNELACRYSYVDIDIKDNKYDFTRIKQFITILSDWLHTI
jgi:aspartate aminotransferase